MELMILLSVLILGLLYLSFPLMFFLTRNKSKGLNGDSKLPPGTMGWPFIGETLAFFNTGLVGVPQKFVQDRMQKFSQKIFRTSILGEPTMVFCGAEANKFLFSNENKLVTFSLPRSVRTIFPSELEPSDSSYLLRTMVARMLKPESLQNYVGIMDSVAKQELKLRWENKNEVAVYPISKKYTFLLSCKVFFSVDDPIKIAKFEDLFNCMAAGIVSIPIVFPGTALYKATKASKVIRSFLQEIIDQRKIDLAEKKATPTQDIMSLLLLTSLEDGRFLNDVEVAGHILGLLIGGHDTSTAAITLTVKYLAELPHIYKEVYREQMEILKAKEPGTLLNWEDIKKMKYSWNVAREVMRLVPPIQGNFRRSLTDFSFAGFTVPSGWQIYWSTYSTHRNANYFPDPEKFDPSRFEGNGPAPYTYVPFGGGPRMCPGNEFARIEIMVFIHNVVVRSKWEKLIPDEMIVVAPIPKPAKDLPIRLQHHECY